MSSKIRKLYEIREYQHAGFSTPMTNKLRDYNSARRLVSRLKKMGHEAFAAPILVRFKLSNPKKESA